jgi:hypothetical protein
LSKLKHLAWSAEKIGAHWFEWVVLKASCPSLESLTLVATQGFDFLYYRKEWKLLHIFLLGSELHSHPHDQITTDSLARNR